MKLFPERGLLERRVWWARLRQAKRTRDTTSTKADGKSSVLKISILTVEKDREGTLNGTPSQESNLPSLSDIFGELLKCYLIF